MTSQNTKKARDLRVGGSSRERLIFALACVTLPCWLGWAVFSSLSASIVLPVFHLDGAFQTASGLYRLDAGQLPGRDFYPYLGIGPLLAVYPFFKVFGADLAASVAAAQLTVFLVGALSAGLLIHLIWRPRSFITSAVAGALSFFAPIAVAALVSAEVPAWMEFAASPGNSLRPLRVAAPYLVVASYYFWIVRLRRTAIRYAAAGVLTGCILLWSNDFAVPSAGLFALLIGAEARRRAELRAPNAIIYLASTILSLAALTTLATQGHVTAWVKYNLIDVAHDQWWLFAPYGEADRIFRFSQLMKLVSSETYLPLLALGLTVSAAVKTRRLEHVLVLWIGTVLFAGGAVSSVGGHLGGYFGGFYFWGVMVLCFGVARLAWVAANSRHLTRLAQRASWCKLAVAILVFAASVPVFVSSVTQFSTARALAKRDPNRFYVAELGGYLGNEWKDYIDLARRTKETRVLEEYWGIWSATRRIVSSWPVDSVIHALGATRQVAREHMRNARIVISTRLPSAPPWQPWNVSQNYWFYEPLFKEWAPDFVGPTTIVWRPAERPRMYKTVDCNANRAPGTGLTIFANAPGLYQVAMQYRYTGASRSLVMVRNNMSFGSDAGGYISIDPNATRLLFPAYIDKPGPATLDAKVVPTGDRELAITSCRAESIPFAHPDIAPGPAAGDAAFFLTDSNWVWGIARHWAGFFVPNTDRLQREYQPGRTVRFRDGQSRQITRIEPNGKYLNVFVSGDPLQPAAVGLPSDFVVDTKRHVD